MAIAVSEVGPNRIAVGQRKYLWVSNRFGDGVTSLVVSGARRCTDLICEEGRRRRMKGGFGSAESER